MDNILITLSLVYDGSKVYVNPKNICAIFCNGNGVTTLLFTGGDGNNYVTVKESVETVGKMIGRARGGRYGTERSDQQTAAIDEIMGQPSEVHYPSWHAEQIKALPPAQLEITDEQAIEHLQESGWMQNHDKQMYEMGLRERLADDSGSYDALLPSAQPEQDREFIKLTVRNSNGRPYYSIIYLVVDGNGVGHDLEGYSSYSLDVISDYLKKYFMPSVQPEIIRCKDCRYGVNFYRDGDCYCSNPKRELTYFGGSWEFYCADAERRTDG